MCCCSHGHDVQRIFRACSSCVTENLCPLMSDLLFAPPPLTYILTYKPLQWKISARSQCLCPKVAPSFKWRGSPSPLAPPRSQPCGFPSAAVSVGKVAVLLSLLLFVAAKRSLSVGVSTHQKFLGHFQPRNLLLSLCLCF